MKRGEGNAMKKDIKWLKKKIGAEMIQLEPNRKERWSDVKYQTLRSVAQKIDQLDELEVLSQAWIDEHLFSLGDNYPWKEAVPVVDLQNLLVPKQEITFDQVHDKLREESILSEKSFDYYWNCINDNVEIDEPGNLIVPKQELPVIPKYVADWIADYREKIDLYPALKKLESNPLALERIYTWYRLNTDKFANAYLTGEYEVEEQRYVIKLPMSTGRDMDFALVDYKGDIWIDAWPNKYELTEQEIRALPKGDVYFEYFAKPVEELEE